MTARRWPALAVAVLLLAVELALLTAAATRASPTIDEPFHLTRGAAFWWTGDTRLSYAHPPLANLLQALPVAFDPPLYDLTSSEYWDSADNSAVARDLLAADYPAVRAAIVRGRFVTVAFAMALSVYVALWCRSRYGARTALFALALLAINPIVLAHGALLTTDMPVAFFSAVALGELVAFLEGGGAGRLASLSIALGCGVATKYNALFLVPFVAGAAGWFAIVGRGRYAGRRLARRLGAFAGQTAATTAILLAIVAASYRFQRTNWSVAEILEYPAPHNEIASTSTDDVLLRDPILRALPPDTRIPLPYSYLYGLHSVALFDAGGRPSYFMGVRGRGFVAYFPVLLAIKNPLVIVLLLALAVAHRAWRGAERQTRVVIAATLFYLVLAMRSNLALGVRHVLPMIPLLCVLAARVAVAIRGSWRGLWRVVGVVGVASAVDTIAASPEFISYFNPLALGHGHWFSIVGEDWGQDVGAFAELAAHHHLAPLWFGFNGPVDKHELAYRGAHVLEAPCKTPPHGPGWVAMHTSMLARDMTCFKWVPDTRPVAVLNHHIVLYWLEAEGAPPPPERLPRLDGE